MALPQGFCFTGLNTAPSHTTWSSCRRGPASSLSPPTSVLVTSSTPRLLVTYAEQASFSSRTNPLPLLQDGAGPTSPGHPPSLRASAATPHPEHQRTAAASPEAPPLTESLWAHTLLRVCFWGGLLKEGVSALSSHASSFLYYLPKFQPKGFLTIKYYLIELCVSP